MSAEPLKKLGKYELQERLGQGGMAEVWRALDTQLQRHVAIKLLHANLQADPNFVTRFQHEAQVIASLHHPNIVQIHDFQMSQPPESEQTIFYMVMAYIEGQTLADYIASTSAEGIIPSPGELVNLFTSISLAVDYAHQRGMIHRDIKPANILLDRHNRTRNPMGEPILTDFGLAKLLGVSAMTMTGTQLGTPLYTSPEQARGYPGNERSDLYSLGVILYEMVTGVPPFRGGSPTEVLAQHLHATPPSPVLLNPNIPPALTMVIMTALAKDPNARFSRAVTLTAAIAEALNVPLPESLGQPAYPPDVRNMPTYIGVPETQAAGSSSSTPPLVSSSPGVSPILAGIPPTVASGSSGPVVAEQARFVTPALWQSPVVSGGATAGFSQGGVAASGGGVQGPPTPVLSAPSGPVAPPASPPERRWRGLYTAVIGLVLLVLLGSGLGAYLAFFRPHSPVAALPGGQALFISSGQFDPGSAQGIADELQIDLHNLPAPAPGKSYYAWLLADRQPHSEAVPLEPSPQFTLPLKIGPLPFRNGTISYFYSGTRQHDNLLSVTSRLLITEENTNGTQLGPTADRGAWRYYAEIPQTPYGNPPLSALDHIRHLFYKETRVAVLGLPGGLDVWLYRNTEKVMEWSVAARDDYNSQGSNAPAIRSLVADILDYLDGSPNVAIDVPGGVPASSALNARVALLSVTPTQQQGTDLANNPPGYLDHFALHLNGVVQAPDATAQMRTLGTQMIEALNNAKTWLQQVRTFAKQLIGMNAAQLGQPLAQTLLDEMLQNATYAYIGQLDPKTNGVVPGVIQVHYDVQKLAALTITSTLPQHI
jgi:serine/threonine protein kinase